MGGPRPGPRRLPFRTSSLAELRRLTRGAQKERVILSRFCHSPAFLDALLDALRSPQSREESESLANLAVGAMALDRRLAPMRPGTAE
jgi:hypothetical protein